MGVSEQKEWALRRPGSMYTLRTSEIVRAIRSGVTDAELMRRYSLSLSGLRRLLQRLVANGAIDHTELYERSPVYRVMMDILGSRTSPRVRIPMALTAYDKKKGRRGFVRDISETGLRLAGIEVRVGESMTMHLPLNEFSGSGPLDLEAVCRWTKIEGKRKRYVVAGFEITSISDEARIRLSHIREFLRSQQEERDQRLETTSEIPELIESSGREESGAQLRRFSGSVDGFDILDLVQFIILSGKRTLLEIMSDQGETCGVYLDSGRIIHAVLGETIGKEAFFKSVNFPGGKFTTHVWNEPVEQSIAESSDFLLMEAARRRDESYWETLSGMEE